MQIIHSREGSVPPMPNALSNNVPAAEVIIEKKVKLPIFKHDFNLNFFDIAP